MAKKTAGRKAPNKKPRPHGIKSIDDRPLPGGPGTKTSVSLNGWPMHEVKTVGDAKAVLEWIVAFRAELKIPHTLGEIGIPEDKAEIVGRDAFRDPSTGGNPRAITEADMTRIFRAARTGDFALAAG